MAVFRPCSSQVYTYWGRCTILAIKLRKKSTGMLLGVLSPCRLHVFACLVQKLLHTPARSPMPMLRQSEPWVRACRAHALGILNFLLGPVICSTMDMVVLHQWTSQEILQSSVLLYVHLHRCDTCSKHQDMTIKHIKNDNASRKWSEIITTTSKTCNLKNTENANGK